MNPRNYFDSSWVKTVTVPVLRVGNRWEFFYGGDVPVADGTRAELRVEASSLSDPRFLNRISAETTVKVLEEGAPLLVALSDPDCEPLLMDGSRAERFPCGIPAGTSRFAHVGIGPLGAPAPCADPVQQELLPETGGLWFKFKGVEKCEMLSSTIVMPAGFRVPCAKSVNHAFTLLSEAYETDRISHTGNVYRRVYSLNLPDMCWYPLDALRVTEQARIEGELRRDLWQDVERKLQGRLVGA